MTVRDYCYLLKSTAERTCAKLGMESLDLSTQCTRFRLVHCYTYSEASCELSVGSLPCSARNFMLPISVSMNAPGVNKVTIQLCFFSLRTVLSL